MSDRRPIEARKTRWASASARLLYNVGLTPNTISVLSVLFAALACGSFIWSKESTWCGLLWGALFVQMRLLCNLFDGMVAIEHGLKSKSGEIYNDFPDRPSDMLILIGAGYAVSTYPFAIELGWLAASVAVLTAYVRVLGKSTGTPVYFMGPMAKQHRMAMITAGALLAIGEQIFVGSRWALWGALLIIAIGSIITTSRRLRRIIQDLESKA